MSASATGQFGVYESGEERPAAEHRMSAEPEVAHGISQFTLKLLYCSEIIALVTFVVQPSFSDEFPWTD